MPPRSTTTTLSPVTSWMRNTKTGEVRRARPQSKYPPRPRTRTGFERFKISYERPLRKLLLNELVGINFVCTFFVGMPIYVPGLSQNNPFSNAFTNSFSARVVRLHRPSATCLVFPGGRVVVVGARYEKQAQWAAWKCCEVLRRCGCIQTTVQDFKVRNIAFTVACGPALDLAAFRNDYQLQVEYKPDQFCGATYYPREDESWTFNLFSTGKMVLTGVKSVKKGVPIYNGQLPIFSKYVCDERPDMEMVNGKMVSKNRAPKRKRIQNEEEEPMKRMTMSGYIQTLEGKSAEEIVESDEDAVFVPEHLRDTAAVLAGLKRRRKRRKPKRRAPKFNHAATSAAINHGAAIRSRFKGF